MKTKIELARREEELIGQQGQNARRETVARAARAVVAFQPIVLKKSGVEAAVKH